MRLTGRQRHQYICYSSHANWPHLQTSTKTRLICKWVPNLPQIICKWTSFANESQFMYKWVLVCKWGVSSFANEYNWVMNSFANVVTHLHIIDSFANESWLVCKQRFICIWVLTHLQMVLTHLQMSHLSFANEPFPPTFF